MCRFIQLDENLIFLHKRDCREFLEKATTYIIDNDEGGNDGYYLDLYEKLLDEIEEVKGDCVGLSECPMNGYFVVNQDLVENYIREAI